MISVVVPAHDEEAVIGRCLTTLLDGSQPGELDIVVACNGCSDNTAKVARQFGDSVRVIETDIASKSRALNLGDRAARHFPRFYVDADIELGIDAVRGVAEALRSGPVLAAAPQLRVDLTGASWAIRAHYKIWMRLPYVRTGMLGCGVYALSAEGRARFEEFPSIIADDYFVHTLFEPVERESVASVSFLMRPPKTIRVLVDINVRRRVGVFELLEHYPKLRGTIERDRRRQRRAIVLLALQPWLWPSLAVYAFSRLSTARLQRQRVAQGRHGDWSRDDSSRRSS